MGSTPFGSSRRIKVQIAFHPITLSVPVSAARQRYERPTVRLYATQSIAAATSCYLSAFLQSVTRLASGPWFRNWRKWGHSNLSLPSTFHELKNTLGVNKIDFSHPMTDSRKGKAPTILCLTELLHVVSLRPVPSHYSLLISYTLFQPAMLTGRGTPFFTSDLCSNQRRRLQGAKWCRCATSDFWHVSH
jgi:hypothetical protein